MMNNKAILIRFFSLIMAFFIQTFLPINDDYQYSKKSLNLSL